MDEVKKFEPKPGQIDFTHARWAPVINCVLWAIDEGKILLVKRSQNVGFYRGYWNGIAGFLDDGLSLEEKAKEEIKDELGLKKFFGVKLGCIFHQAAPEIGKTWIVHPVAIFLKDHTEIISKKIRLNWEAEDFKWVDKYHWREEVRFKLKLKIMPGFERVLDNLPICPHFK